jgi:hypothetical protein
MTEVLLPIEVIFSRRIADLVNADAGGDGLEFAVAVDFAGQAVERVIRQNQFDDIAAEPLDILRVRIDVVALLDRRVAGGHDLGAAALRERDIDAADAARAEGFEIGRVAEGRNGVGSEVAAQEGDDGFSVFDFPRTIVDVGEFHEGSDGVTGSG